MKKLLMLLAIISICFSFLTNARADSCGMAYDSIVAYSHTIRVLKGHLNALRAERITISLAIDPYETMYRVYHDVKDYAIESANFEKS